MDATTRERRLSFSEVSRDRNGDHVLQIQGVAPCGQMLKIRRKQDGQGTLVFERRKGQRRNVCLRCGQCAADPNKMPSKVGSLGNPLQEPDVCSGRRTETYRAEMRVGAVISSERCVMCLGQCFLGHKRLARLCFCRSHRAPCASCACSISFLLMMRKGSKMSQFGQAGGKFR